MASRGFARDFDCAVIGDWHLAFITAASLAKLGRKTVLVKPDTQGGVWAEFPKLELNEPGLTEVIGEARARGLLDYANGLEDGLGKGFDAEILWLAIDTPVNERDEADVEPLKRVAEAAAKRFPGRVFAISSQIPLGFCGELEKELGLKTCYVPENLRLGKGLETFLKADRTVIGANSSEVQKQMRGLLEGLQTEFFFCDSVTAEMIKHATNAFLAASISFANELARVGERMGVDNQKVAQGLKLDKRIGKGAYVAPGLGFAGGTLPRDLRILQALGKQHGIPTRFVDAVLDVNDSGYEALTGSVLNALGGLKGKSVLLLGYSYKADIDTLRRSPAIELARLLASQGAELRGFDPMMNDRDLSELKGLIKHCPNWDDIGPCPDAVVVMTGRIAFKALDWKHLLQSRAAGAEKVEPLVLDACNVLDLPAIRAVGWAVKALWQPVIR